MKTKLLCMLLLCTMLFSLLAACSPATGNGGDGTGTGDGTSTGDQTTDSVEEKVYLPIVQDGKAMNIVYAMDNLDNKEYAVNIATKLKTMTGVEAKVKDDWYPVGKEQDSESYEILVGVVDYPEYETARKQFGYGGSGICVVGNKICLVGAMTSDVSGVVIRLFAQLNTMYDETTNSILMESTYTLVSSQKEVLSAIPIFTGKEHSGSYESTSNAYQVIFPDIKSADVDDYCEIVEEAGYTFYVKNEDTTIGNKTNRFLTYYNDKYVLTVTYLPADKEMRVIAETRQQTALAGLPTDNVYTKGVCETTLTQVGLLYKAGNMNGMAYVMRLEDGSFIVMDGGHSGDDYATRLYNVIKSQAPDPNNIVIAAWFFSHTHGDHTGFFSNFTKLYADKVTVERFIYNFPVENQFNDAEKGTGSANGGIELQMSKYKGAEIVRARTGQVYYIRNATVRMLYTADLYLPTIINYGNTASVCFQIEAEGLKTMITGDIGAQVADVMLGMYNTNYFKSDILQVAHHGIGSHPNALYPYIDPSYALWPLGTGPLSKWSAQEDCIVNVQAAANKWFFESEKCKDHVYLAEDDVYVLTLKDSAVTKVEKYDNVDAYLAR